MQQQSLIHRDVRLRLPHVVILDEKRVDNRIRQIADRNAVTTGTLAPFSHPPLEGALFTAPDGVETVIVTKAKAIPDSITRVVQTDEPLDGDTLDLSAGRWLKHPITTAARGTAFDYAHEMQLVRDSWRGAFSYAEESAATGTKGLRAPQIGAVHAVHAHWTVSERPATIVMPTGTGKTETMLSVLVSARCEKVLVVVPTDALRTQIADKFLTLGVLKEPGSPVLKAEARSPIVGTLEHIPRDIAEVDDVFGRCQVIVTTSSIAGQCKKDVQERIAAQCSHLFIDEAHHVEAPTWTAFKERFRHRRVLQFTATPFREDGKPLDGELIFAYPLRKAQEEGYFKPIRFRRVTEFNQKRADEAIAKAAIEQLKADADKGHILMARTDSVKRASEVFALYEPYAEFKPVQLHTGITSIKERERIRRQILTRESRIVVCVDMLGEGFDLPELKIAAFHDIRKTLAVTLQLAGRFTRSRPDLGDATFIANTADVQVQDELRKLYSRDPDWNILLPGLSERMVGEQLSLQEFLRGFSGVSKDIPIKTVRPAMSTVVYKTKCTEWHPENFRSGVPGLASYEQVYESVNEEKHMLVAVMGRRASLTWANSEKLYDWTWELYVIIWDPTQNLLFINSSMNAGEYKSLAEAIAGNDVALIKGQEVFRAFAGVNRLRFQNIGLSEQLGRNIRYTGHMGGDVEMGLSDLQRGRGSKSVLSGMGFEGGKAVAVGASRRGRIWSHQRGRVDQLAEWCYGVGGKLLDTSVNPDEIVRGTLTVRVVGERPKKFPFGIDWPEDTYTDPETMWTVSIDGRELPLAETAIELEAPSETGALQFAIASETHSVLVTLEFCETDGKPDYRFGIEAGHEVKLIRGLTAYAAQDFFYRNPPMIWFTDGSSLAGNEYTELKNPIARYDAAKIETLDWTGVNIRNESQGPLKDPASVQGRVIAKLKGDNYDLVFDDDGKGEVADIVAAKIIRDEGAPASIELELYHCKYSGAETPGRRLKDLYEVSGQGQKSVSWLATPDKKTDIFTHLLHRESLRRDANAPTRIEVGNGEGIETLREMSRILPVRVKVYIVQPGLSRAVVSDEQLHLLGVVQNYLWDKYQLTLGVIASA